MKKLILICMIIICMFMVSGCKKATKAINTSDATVAVKEQITEEATKTTKTPEAASVTENPSKDTVQNSTRDIVDMAGRTVRIPETIESAFGVNNNASILLYTLAPELMIGWNSVLSEKSKKYITASEYNLPALGTLIGNSEEVNLEEIIAKNPNLIIFLQPDINDKAIQTADKLQKKLSIPVVMVDGGFEQYDKAYDFLGSLLGREEKASSLAKYCEDTYKLAASVKETYAAEASCTIYYGSGKDGLTTVAADSSQSATIDMLGAVNVVDSKNLSKENSSISIEELMTLNPQYIILGNSGFTSGGVSDNLNMAKGWNTLLAVMNDKVYKIPQLPFNWFDKPPSVNRILGIHWLISILYPDYKQEDIVIQTKEYFKLFYHVEIKEAEIRKMLGIK